MQKTWKALVLTVTVVALIAASCSSDDEGSGEFTLVTADTLTVCTDAPYPPMEFEEDGEFTGFDMELMKAIAAEMGLGFAVVNSGFDPITSGAAMVAGDCDIAAASITITDEREANIDFSAPYFLADQSLLVKGDSGITTLAQTSGQTVAVQSGTTGEAYARLTAPSDTEIKSFDNPGDLFVALEAQDVVGVLQDIVVNQDRADNDTTVVVVETYPTNEFYGFAVKNEGSELLMMAVNESLSALRRAGTYDQIFSDWFG